MGTTRAQRSLPSILRKRARTTAEREAALDALATHLGLSHKDVRVTLECEPHASVVAALVRFFVPAFHVVPPKERNPKEDFESDWHAAGGGLLWSLADRDAFYQAQLVQAILRLQAERKGASRSHVFRWLANEVQRTTPGEASKRLENLPRRYRSRRTSGSLKQAFDSIPSDVRRDPAAYLPKAAIRSSVNLGFPSDTQPGERERVSGLLSLATEED